MAQWRYTLNGGKYLRDAIDNEDINEILLWLENLYTDINDKFPEEFDEISLKSVIADIEGVGEDWENGYMDEEEVESSIDFLLNNFYDLCDNMKIWVGI